MKTLKHAACGIALAAISGFTNSADKNHNYAIQDTSCEQYLRDRATTATSLPHVAWAAGYISAYNRLVEDTYDIAKP